LAAAVGTAVALKSVRDNLAWKMLGQRLQATSSGFSGGLSSAGVVARYRIVEHHRKKRALCLPPRLEENP
jgi:hypothetical protein